MKRALLLAGTVVLAVTAALVAQQLTQERRYRRLLTAGELALRERQAYAAVEAFSGALALRPDAVVALYRRGEAYAQQGQDINAIRDWKRAIEVAPEAPQPLQALGALYDRRGQPAAAADWYARAAERLHDGDPTLLYDLALAHYRAGNPALARPPLSRALARNDAMPEAHYLLGLVHHDARALESAAASLERAIRLAPGFVPAREELAEVYRELGRHEDAREQLTALASADPQVDRQVTLALADMQAGRFEDALAGLTDAAAMAPGDSRVTLALGRVYLQHAEQTGRRISATRALALLEQALGGTARRSEGLALFGRALFVSGDAAGAERILVEATATSPADPEAFGFLADAAERLGHAEIGYTALVRVTALQGDTVSAAVRVSRLRRMGTLALLARRWAAAAEALEAVLHEAPPDAATLGLLARARWEEGDAAAARTALERALTLEPGQVELQRLARRIR